MGKIMTEMKRPVLSKERSIANLIISHLKVYYLTQRIISRYFIPCSIREIVVLCNDVPLKQLITLINDYRHC